MSFTKLQQYHQQVLISYSSDSANVLRFTMYNALQQQFQEKPTEDFISQFSTQINIFETTTLFKQSKITKAQSQGLNQIPNKRFISFWSPLINRSEIHLGKTETISGTNIEVKGRLNTLKQFYINLFQGKLWNKLHRGLVCDLKMLLNKLTEYPKLEVDILENHQDKAIGNYSHKSNSPCISDLHLKGYNECKETQLSVIQIMENNFSTSESSIPSYIDVKLIWPNVDQFPLESIKLFCMHDYRSLYVTAPFPVRVYVDLVYSRQFIVGPTQDFSLVLQRSLVQWVNQCRPMHQFKSKLSNLLQIFTLEQKTKIINEQNFNLVLKNKSMFFYLKEQISNQQFTKILYSYDVQSAVLQKNTFSLQRSQTHKSSQFQIQIEEQINQILKEAKPKLVFTSNKHLQLQIQKLVQLENLSQHVYLSELDLSFEALSNASFDKVHLDPFSNESVFRFLLVLKTIELFGLQQTQKIICKSNQQSNIYQMFQIRANGKRTQDEIDNELKELVVQNYCDKFGIEKHLLNQQQVLNIILGATIDPDEFIMNKTMQFTVKKEDNIKVASDSKFNFYGIQQKLTRRINNLKTDIILKQYDESKIFDFEVENEMNENEIQVSGGKNHKIKPIIIPSNIKYLQNIAKAGTVVYLFGIELEDCYEIWKASKTLENDIEQLQYVAKLQFSENIEQQPQDANNITIYSDFLLQQFYSDIELLISPKLACTIEEWWE
ncbi:Putative_pre-mRNA-processing-splicing factor [Hexamita inflata]|uniref:Pre-mRNA-processing-splicing factor n=1 Tax=Hexamita inflata TaxID=28002 RepID=A0AA86P9S6_9EUKA|nr:Putative pre-mRNA-processing-splicing factor [Hexamita inflata]